MGNLIIEKENGKRKLLHPNKKKKGGEVKIKPMEANPGLLYDPFKKIHLIREEWQLVSSINVEKLVNLYPHSNQTLWEAYGICSLKFNHSICMSYIRVKSHQEIQTEIEQAQHRLRQLLEDPRLEKFDSQKRSKRAPWFGFVGTIARELFGTMDYSDKEHIT
ncbi:GSCOCG00012329001-RA-CDS [Cotesia congregata]|nr:GSCOCG00012329001-RA-CDS [Cotesia congregata]